jgi:hypothetical protein
MTKLLVSLIAAAVLLVPATAGAATFCINSPTCVASGGTNVGTGAKALQNSLDQAAKLAGEDHVVVGAGTYVRSGSFSYDVGSIAGNPVVLEGAGSAQTVLQNSSGSGSTLAVRGPGSTVKGLRTVLADGPSPIGLSIAGANTVAHDVAVRGQPNTTSGTGVILGGGTLQKGDIVSTGTQLLYGAAGDGKVADSSVTGPGYGIYGPRTVQRTTVQGSSTGVMANGSALPYQFDQLRIAVPVGGRGVVAASTASYDTVLTADHLTITGIADGGSVGVVGEATSGGQAPHDAKFVLRSSIVRRVGHPVGIWASNGAANLEVDHSDVNLSGALVTLMPGGSGAVTDLGGNLNVDPLFVSSSDRHLQAGSPVIDKGRPSLQPNESPTDLDGAARLVGPATDMGAYEVHP